MKKILKVERRDRADTILSIANCAYIPASYKFIGKWYTITFDVSSEYEWIKFKSNLPTPIK